MIFRYGPIALLGVIGLAACNLEGAATADSHAEAGTQTADAPEAQTAPVPSAAPAAEDGYGWNFRAGEQNRGVLAYEVDNTDDQPLAFTCLRASGELQAVGPAGGGTLEMTGLTLAAGDRSDTYPVRVEEDELGPRFTSDPIAGDDPVMMAFGENGWLTAARSDRDTRNMVASAEGHEQIRAFLRYCNDSRE